MSPPASSNSITRVLLLPNSIAMGGMEEHVRLLARHLDRHDFEVFVVCPDWPATTEFGEQLRKVADHVELISPDRRYGFSQQIRESIKLTRQVRAWKIDVAHFHSTTFRGQTVAALCVRLGGAKRIYVTEHLAPDLPLPTIRRLWRRGFNWLISGIVCVSQKNYEARAERIITPPDKTLIVPNGVDVERFDPIEPDRLSAVREEMDIPAGVDIIGTVVRFEPEKGLDDLINAFTIIHTEHPSAMLMLVGDGSLRGALERQVADLGLTPWVRFTGFRPDPREYLGAMDVFVLPVPVGSMSIGLLEAMAMGKACVMTFGGEGEAVIHGESGFSAEPHDPASIASYVLKLLDEPDLRRQIGRSARTRVETHFSAAQVATTLGRLYRFGMRSVEHPAPHGLMSPHQ